MARVEGSAWTWGGGRCWRVESRGKVGAGAGMRHLHFILEVGKDTNGHQAGDRDDEVGSLRVSFMHSFIHVFNTVYQASSVMSGSVSNAEIQRTEIR